jgi:hypothetical protein
MHYALEQLIAEMHAQDLLREAVQERAARAGASRKLRPAGRVWLIAFSLVALPVGLMLLLRLFWL